jgi:hypothetical protein
MLGILPRLGLALVPWLTGELIDRWFSFRCFGSESPLCIYYWYPPGMDVMFALLVLAPFMTARRLVALRVLALIALSVLVHGLSVGFLVDTRGVLEIPGVNSIFLNVIPIAILASVVTVLLTALACDLKLTWRFAAYSVLAGLPVAAGFLLADLTPLGDWLSFSDNWLWAVWHLSICVAIYYGRLADSRRESGRTKYAARQ